uniref:Uncharacterized protein n=1 Tax=Oncorhynchus tshawytscha TaxID=74940 RepID=A0A8C8BSI8_ONCTS
MFSSLSVCPCSRELMDLENCVSNLNLAHEIVINRDFVFRQTSPPKDRLEGRVTDIVPESTVNCLREQLSCSPPDYTHLAITGIPCCPCSCQAMCGLRAQVEEVLDLDLIQQQADHGALVLQRLSGYIINTMASLCAPKRDPEIRTYRTHEIFRVLGLMTTNMVNFTYEQATFHENLLRLPYNNLCGGETPHKR